VPYVWGGKAIAGIDCSGLLQTSLQAAGKNAPRDTDMMEAALGSEIAKGETLRRGDLVFWRRHVGVMRDAETLLHANAFFMASMLIFHLVLLRWRRWPVVPRGNNPCHPTREDSTAPNLATLCTPPASQARLLSVGRWL
jgi:cell wall-associated NlpC family hydrolase